MDDLGQHLGFVFVMERVFANEHSVEQNAQTPRVCLLAVIRLAPAYLRGDVERAAALGPQGFRGVVRQAEVDELDVALRVEHHVLRLDVPVRDAAAVARHDALDHLREDLQRLARGQALRGLAAQEVVKLDAAHQLHHQEEILRVLVGSVELDHVGVAHRVQGGRLPAGLHRRSPLEMGVLSVALPREDLHGDVLARDHVLGLADHRRRALAQDLLG
mmetsp:Transcript_22419/g.44998  ORF Transcript_22419/g.44998 Transcript_22419/m.44998 type:complete len:217 (+) Transcript_22419:92-742(+)